MLLGGRYVAAAERLNAENIMCNGVIRTKLECGFSFSNSIAATALLLRDQRPSHMFFGCDRHGSQMTAAMTNGQVRRASRLSGGRTGGAKFARRHSAFGGSSGSGTAKAR